MHFWVFLLEVMHFFEICNFPWRYALLRFNFINNFKQCKLKQCNNFWDTYITNSSLKECNFFVCYATVNNTNLTLCNFKLCNIFWGHLITQLKVLLYIRKQMYNLSVTSKKRIRQFTNVF
jgi:hypothetical protein